MNWIYKLEAYLDNTDVRELANDLDYILQTKFNDIDPDFKNFYEKELQRFLWIDSLHHKVLLLKEYKRILKQYKKDLNKYHCLISHQKELTEMYEAWTTNEKELKKALKIHYVDINRESFYKRNKENIKLLFSESEISYVSGRSINQMLSGKINKPEVPAPLTMSDLQKYDNISTAQNQTSAQLLARLGKTDLQELAHIIVDSIGNQSTEALRIFLLFSITHKCNSSTSGKEYERTDKQGELKDPSKTSKKTQNSLTKQYNDLINELNIT